MWNPESAKNLHVESGILGFRIRNTAQGIRNPTKDWNSDSTDKDWDQVPGIQNLILSWAILQVKSLISIT